MWHNSSQRLQLTYETSVIGRALFLRSRIAFHPGTKLGKNTENGSRLKSNLSDLGHILSIISVVQLAMPQILNLVTCVSPRNTAGTLSLMKDKLQQKCHEIAHYFLMDTWHK